MISGNAVRNMVGIIGNAISFCLYIAPVPTFIKIWKRRDVEQFSPIPYLASLLNCMLWSFYGLPFVTPNSFLVVTINAPGAVIEAIYLSTYFVFSTKRQRLREFKILVTELAFMVLLIVPVLTLVHTHEKRTLIVGVLSAISSACMYASPLSVMKMVIQKKSVKYMPFYLSLAGFLNGVCWLAYALIRFDPFIAIPNGLGALFGAIQLVLYGCYYSSTSWNEGAMTKSEMELPTTNSTATADNGSI